MKKLGWCVAVGIVAIGVACGGQFSSGTSGVGGGEDAGVGDAGGDARTDGGGQDGGGGTILCPASPPEASKPCAPLGRVCEYGDDPRRQCHTLATCDSGGWQVTSPRCTAIPPTICPQSRDEAAEKACAPRDAYCNYSGVVCHCTNCDPRGPVVQCGTTDKWICDTPNPDPQCPTGMPNLGTPCQPPAKICDYTCDQGRECKGGVWVSHQPPGGCPVSSRAAKRDIVYVDEAAKERIARSVLATPLATYAYVDPARGDRRHLGFILEDRGSVYGSNPEHSQVDLYGYVSEMLATIQVQQRQIDELRREVRARDERERGRTKCE